MLALQIIETVIFGKMYRNGGSGVSQDRSVPSFLHSIVEEEQMALQHPTIAESARIKRVPNSSTLSSASRAIHERNQELEKRLVKVERAVAEGSVQSAPSRSLGPSSASIALQRRNEELENELARLENLVLKKSINSREHFIPRPLSKGSYSGVVSNSQLRQYKRRPNRIGNQELRKMLQQAQELDLAFLVDATNSMRMAIDEVKNLAPRIASGVKKAFPKLKLRVAFVPYRDYDEHDQDHAEKCDFTDSFEGPASTLVTAVAKVKAAGGGDTAEDVFSGLERVATLGWSSKTRVLIHIGDAPCHGREFHDDEVNDEFPDGDSKGRDIGKLLEALRHKCQILNYLFCHMNKSTKKMLAVFRERAPQGGWIQEQKLGNINNLLELVVSASCSSISVSTRVIGEGPSVLRYVPVAWKNEIPMWNNIKRQCAFQFKYKTPATLEDLFKIVDENGSLKQETTPIATVQIALRPFSDSGTMRWPYHALEHDPESPSTPPRRMVVKRFKDVVGEDVSKVHTMEAYLEQMEVQTVAAFMAKHFNQELERSSGLLDYKTVQFTAVSVLMVGGSMLYNMEKWLEGTWIRYSNNVNYVNTKEYAATLHAFSHWTHERSKGRLMVTDLQGVQVDGSNGKKVFMLCDPAVHCKHVSRYERTKTNWSSAGMESFFETHQCNDVCRSLKLTPKSSFSSFQGTGIAIARWKC